MHIDNEMRLIVRRLICNIWHIFTIMSNNIHILIPRLIRRIRLEKSLSQEELAHRAGLDRTYISAVERGVRNITIKSLEKILSALEVDIDVLSAELIYENRLD